MDTSPIDLSIVNNMIECNNNFVSKTAATKNKNSFFELTAAAPKNENSLIIDLTLPDFNTRELIPERRSDTEACEIIDLTLPDFDTRESIPKRCSDTEARDTNEVPPCAHADNDNRTSLYNCPFHSFDIEIDEKPDNDKDMLQPELNRYLCW